MIQFKENARTDGKIDGGKTDGWKDGQTLFYRTLPSITGGPKSEHLYNLGLNIFRLFDILPIFFFTTSEMNHDY